MNCVVCERRITEGQERLLKVFRDRLRDGDRPTVVLHEVLLAGVSPQGLRKVLNEATIVSERAHQTAKELSLLDDRTFGQRIGVEVAGQHLRSFGPSAHVERKLAQELLHERLSE